MRQTILSLFVCLSLTACTIGIVKREQIVLTVPPASISEPTATVTAFTPTPSNALTPTSLASPLRGTPLPVRTPTRLAVPSPIILSFTVKPTEINPGESVTLTWATTDTVRTSLRRTAALGVSFEQDVPPSGSLVMESEEAGRHWNDYALTAYNSAGITTTRSLTVRIYCANSFFFTTASLFCPNGPAQSSWAAEQVFEGGRMLWLEDGSLVDAKYKGQSLIFVLYTQGRSWELYVATWTSIEPDRDPSLVPPQGLYQPIRGFGKVWRDNPQVQKRLGWALADERGFEILYQRVSEFDWDNQCHYLSTADDRVVSLCSRGGVWSFVTP
jgi:hypothetical protein